MRFRRVGAGFWMAAVGMLWLVSATGTVAGQAPAAPQSGATAQPGVQMTENVFRNIQVLKGMPVDTFFDVMGMFAASMGADCTWCHSKDAVFRHEAFAETTPRIARARQMVAMMQNINKNFFRGEPRITCFTCHRGTNKPVAAPILAQQYGVPEDDPNVIDFPEDTSVPAAELLDKYLRAIGGTAALSAVTSFTAKGTYAGFDTGHKEVPVDIYAKAPNQRTWIIHMPEGDSRRVFDGQNGWWAGPDAPVPVETLTAGNLDRYRLEALIAFPAGIKQAFKAWKVGRTAIDDKPVHIVQGSNPGSGLLPVNFYFDNMTGLLVRMVRWNGTPLGPVPTEINYDDYRDVNGAKMPFTWTVSQTYMQMTIKLAELRPNVAIDSARFARPN